MKWVINKFKGFTLIELIVVILVIAVLVTLAVVGINRYQITSRDTERLASANKIVDALEKFYDQNGAYPSCSALTTTASTVIASTLKDIDPSALVTPQAASGQTNSIECTSDGNILTIKGKDFFEYQGDGSLECNNAGACQNFTLKYKNEIAEQIKSITSRRAASATSSQKVTDLSANATGASAVVLTWTAAKNASTYVVQTSTDTAFVAGLSQTSSQTTNVTVAGLLANKLYYFRVATMNGSIQDPWSDTASTTTQKAVL